VSHLYFAITNGKGGKFKLPTEAQWEYACRAGSTTKYSFGDEEARLSDYAWYGANSEGKTHPVGKKKPNAFGLYDMHGNVYEWCEDWYYWNSYVKAPVNDPRGPITSDDWEQLRSPTNNPKKPTGTARVLRGGGWDSNLYESRAAFRFCIEPGGRYDFLGFRISQALADE
jgi:formylglycine-generating enzyme required for sulfatase activity